jgi:histidinol-phosphate/aromatic aminotransferase/cobyric acid decarboxylase-like protein
MSDEIYGEILYDGAEHHSLLRYAEIRDRVILLDGWSKTYAMTGWRLGYGVWPKALFPHAEKLAINCHSCVNAATQFAGIAALKGPREPVERMVRAFAERREIIVEALNTLPGMRCASPAGRFIPSPTCRAPATPLRACRLNCWIRPGSRRSPAPALARSARTISESPTPTASRRSVRRSNASGVFSAIYRVAMPLEGPSSPNMPII